MGAESLRGVSACDARGFHLHLDIVLQAHHLGLAGVELPGGALIRGHPGFTDVVVPRGQREAVQEKSQQAQHGYAGRRARPREALERQQLGQAGLGASAWKRHIYQAMVAGCPRDLSAARLQTARNLFFPKGQHRKLRASVSQTADGQIKKSPVTPRPPNLAFTPLPEANLIKSGGLSNCDSGWKWDREKIRRDLAGGWIRLLLIFVLPINPGL